MTYDEFVATRSAYICKCVAEEDCATGYTYEGRWHIFDVRENWPPESKRKGKYCLFLDENEYYSNDLGLLEQRLYRWTLVLKNNSHGI